MTDSGLPIRVQDAPGSDLAEDVEVRLQTGEIVSHLEARDDPVIVVKGGEGSGYTKEKGHKGRPGEVGGSVPSDKESVQQAEKTPAPSQQADYQTSEDAGQAVQAVKAPKVRLRYDPSSTHEAASVSIEGGVDVMLGPKFWKLQSRGSRAHVLAHEVGHEIVDRYLHDSGVDFWQVSDSLIAPANEQWGGEIPNFIFNTLRADEALSEAYASYLESGEKVFRERGGTYLEALDIVKEAIAFSPEFDYTYSDFMEWANELPPDDPEIKGIDTLQERGGPGSGHHGHRGRPGEVGGSLPSGGGKGMMAVGGVAKPKAPTAPSKAKPNIVHPTAKYIGTVHEPEWEGDFYRIYKDENFGNMIDEQIDGIKKTLGGFPKEVTVVADNARDAATAVRMIEQTEKLKDDPNFRLTALQMLQIEADLLNDFKRLAGGTMSTRTAEDDLLVYIDAEKVQGDYTYTSGDQEITIPHVEGEAEFVIDHEISHAIMADEDTERHVQIAHFDLLDEKYPSRMEEIAVPDFYGRYMIEAFGPRMADISKIQNEFYADVISYGLRLERNPDEQVIAIRGKHILTLDDWGKGSSNIVEDPRELAGVLVQAIRDSYAEREAES